MKLFRRTSALVMAMVLVLSLSIGVLAADFDNMADGFAYDGEDTEININLSTTDGSGTFEAKDGKTYTISSENDSELHFTRFTGSGTVEVNVYMYQLTASESVTVTVNGDVDYGTYVSDSADVTITGQASWVQVYDQAELTVNGSADSITVNNETTATVNGEVSKISLRDEATATINGEAGSIDARGQTEITVNGDVTGFDGNSEYVDLGNSQSGSTGEAGIYASDGATVTVTGNVSGGDGYGTCGHGGMGINAGYNATVTVGGDVTGGSVIADPNTEAAEAYPGGPIYVSSGGTGISAYSGATVTVGGSVTGGSTNGDCGSSGTAIAVNSSNPGYGPAIVTVTGTATAGKAENGTEKVDITADVREDQTRPSVTVYDYNTAEGTVYHPYNGYHIVDRDLTQEELDEIITTTKDKTPPANDGNEGGSSPATRAPDYGTSFYYSRGRLINEHGMSVRALFAFGNDWEETVENGTVTITSAEKKGEIVVTVESLKVMMDVGIETILFNGTKLVLKDAVAARSAYDTYTITASAILLNGEAV